MSLLETEIHVKLSDHHYMYTCLYIFKLVDLHNSWIACTMSSQLHVYESVYVYVYMYVYIHVCACVSVYVHESSRLEHTRKRKGEERKRGKERTINI